MKKSEYYNMAQIAVVSSACISPENKLEIIRILMADECMAQYIEEQQAKAAGEE